MSLQVGRQVCVTKETEETEETAAGAADGKYSSDKYPGHAIR